MRLEALAVLALSAICACRDKAVASRERVRQGSDVRVERWGQLRVRIIGGEDGEGGGRGPVIVLMHGFGAPGEDLVPLGQVLRPPDNARFVFPEAPLRLETGFSFFESRAWWMIDIERYQRALMTGEVRDMTRETPEGLTAARDKVIELLDEIEKRLGVSGDRIVIGGFSQGAMLATDVFLHTDRKLAGLVILSGTLLAADAWLPRLKRRAGARVFQSHGREDPLLPFFVAEHLHQELAGAGLSAEWVPFSGGHEIPSRVLSALGTWLDGTVTRK